MPSKKTCDKHIYKLAIKFLTSLKLKNGRRISLKMLKEYTPTRPKKISGIYERLLSSAQNANMKSGVIGGSINGISNLRPVLCNFQPKNILSKYNDDSNRVLQDINRKLKPRGQVNMAAAGLWPKYCKTILAGARFMSQFSSEKDFYKWADFFYDDDRARDALPLLLKAKIFGFGLALSCDFLKELGYVKFAKPDVHLRFIFNNLKLCQKGATDDELLAAIIRVAKNNDVTPYEADKMFWLIGSGKFYLHNLKAGKNREKFVAYVKNDKKKKKRLK
jgi:hypothetical protein